MIHAVCFPSATVAKAEATARAWASKGYVPVVMLDPGYRMNAGAGSWMVGPARFPGYYRVITGIVSQAFCDGADLVTCIGDDMDPPEQGAECIADMYFANFGRDGFGVLQGTGDMQSVDQSGRQASARVCGSPTFGRAWKALAFQGKGPFGDYGFKSYYGDELLHDVADLLGVLWNEPTIKILHRHWSYGLAKREEYHERASQNWQEDQAIYFRLKAEGYPGHEPLPPGTLGGRADSISPDEGRVA